MYPAGGADKYPVSAEGEYSVCILHVVLLKVVLQNILSVYPTGSAAPAGAGEYPRLRNGGAAPRRGASVVP